MDKLNRSLPNIKLMNQEQVKRKRDSDSVNRSGDLRNRLTGNPGKSSQKRSHKHKEKSDRKVYYTKRKQYDGNDIIFKRSRRDFVSVAAPHAPMYEHHQLLGDSQLLRFSEQLLNYRDCVSFTEATFCKRIGYCVSGQKIKDLKERIESEEFTIYPYVIMLIGTNDVLHETDLLEMYDNYKKILRMLKEKCRKIVLLTVPPIPRLENKGKHWFTLRNFNEFLQTAADGIKVFTLDLCSVFISYNNSISKEYYESFYIGSPPRPDWIHLNRKGFLMLKSVLDIFFETSKESECNESSF